MSAGRKDLALSALAAAGLHAALLAWAPLYLLSSPASAAQKRGNISIEVDLSAQRPSSVASPPVPEIEVREPSPPEFPLEREPELPEEQIVEPEPEEPLRPVYFEAPVTPREVLKPEPKPEEPRPGSLPGVRSGRTGNRAASVARHYIRHPDEGKLRVREGTVRVRIQVLASGRVGELKILKSSGHQDLDRAVLRGLRRAKCPPALQDGEPVDAFIEKTVDFKELIEKGRRAPG